MEIAVEVSVRNSRIRPISQLETLHPQISQLLDWRDSQAELCIQKECPCRKKKLQGYLCRAFHA